MFFTETTNIAATKKLDYSLKTAEERQEFVANIVAQMTKEQLKIIIDNLLQHQT